MTDPTPPFPDLEIELLANTAALAVDLARARAVEQCYAELAHGLKRARTLLNEPWGEELLRRYRHALEHYGEEYGRIRISSPPTPPRHSVVIGAQEGIRGAAPKRLAPARTEYTHRGFERYACRLRH